MCRQGVWLIIAGVLLLWGPTAAAADSYLRVRKKGVTYYYFNGRKSRPAQPERNHQPPAQSPPALSLSPASWEADYLNSGSLPRPELPKVAAGAEMVQPPEAPVQIWAGARYLMDLLTKLGYQAPVPLPASRPGAERLDLQATLPTGPVLAALAPGPGGHLRPGPQSPQASWGQRSTVHAGPGQLLYCFPVGGAHSFRDGFADYRSGGRLHRAIDIFAQEGTPVFAITGGVVHTLAWFHGGGLTLLMQGQDGRGYGYMHLQGYAPGIMEGRRVRAGELLGYVGRTGLLTSPAHLHFQVYADNRLDRTFLLNPYHLLVQLCHGVGVSDLSQHQLASLPKPPVKASRIQVYRRQIPTINLGRGQRKAKDILVIRNY